MKTIDEKDNTILEVLREHSNWSTKKIAKKTLIPITTVHNRIKKLEKLGIIKKYTVKVDHKKLGDSISAFVVVRLDIEELRDAKIYQDDFAKDLMRLSFISKVVTVAGEADFIVKIHVKDIDELNDLVTKELRGKKGIRTTQTLIILKEVS